MKTLTLTLIAIVFTLYATQSFAATAKVIKTEGVGNCNDGQKFRWKYHVDLNDDNKADHIITVWCNGSTTINKAIKVSGSWPNAPSWNTVLNYDALSSTQSHYWLYTLKDPITNDAIGTESKDSLSNDVEFAFYSSMRSNSIDKYMDRAPVLDFVPNSAKDAASTLRLEYFHSGEHQVMVRLEDGSEKTFRIVSTNERGFFHLELPNIKQSDVQLASILRPEGSIDSATSESLAK